VKPIYTVFPTKEKLKPQAPTLKEQPKNKEEGC